jgi:hypothetical protein
MLKAGLRLVGIAMLSCPMIGLEPIGQTSEGCHTVHRLTTIIIFYRVDSNRIICVHSQYHHIIAVESSCQHSAVLHTPAQQDQH